MRERPPLVPPDIVRKRYAEVLPRGDALALEALFALRSATQSIERIVGRILGADALSPGRYQVLVVLWAHEVPVPQREIVTALNVSRANVSVLVEALRETGMVTVAPDPTSRRQMLVALTAEGRVLTRSLIERTAKNLRDNMRMGNAQLSLLAGLLTDVALRNGERTSTS